MKLIVGFLMALVGSTGFSQEIEKDICQCISDNYNAIGINVTEVYEELETSLIQDNIITDEFQSRIDKIREFADSGKIEEIRSFEHVDFERVNIKIIKFCVDIHTISEQRDDVHSAFKMFQELERIGYLAYESGDYKNLREQSARTLLRYVDRVDEESKLWDIIILSFLYGYTYTEQLIEIPKFLESDEEPKLDTLNLVQVFINDKNEVRVQGKLLEVEDLCDSIQSSIIAGKVIHFQSNRKTGYKIYLDVYNKMKACYAKVRNEMAIKEFDENFEKLTDAEKKVVLDKYPIKIYESDPIK